MNCLPFLLLALTTLVSADDDHRHDDTGYYGTLGMILLVIILICFVAAVSYTPMPFDYQSFYGGGRNECKPQEINVRILRGDSLPMSDCKHQTLVQGPDGNIYLTDAGV